MTGASRAAFPGRGSARHAGVVGNLPKHPLVYAGDNTLMNSLVHRLLRHIYRKVFPQWAKNQLAVTLAGIERHTPPAIVELPPGKRLIVLAPHADDESIGCGGTIAKCVAAGVEVHVLILTDGKLGSRALRAMPAGPARLQTEQMLVAQRRAEARNAMDALGVRHLYFMDAPDGSRFGQDDAVADELGAWLEGVRPDTIFLPFLTDRHADHWETNRCLMWALERKRLPWLESACCYGYEVWAPLYANTVVDITGWVDAKRAAIEKYRTQVADTDYVSAVIGLNRYRSITCLEGRGYAEAFYVATMMQYRRLYRHAQLQST